MSSLCSVLLRTPGARYFGEQASETNTGTELKKMVVHSLGRLLVFNSYQPLYYSSRDLGLRIYYSIVV